MSRSESESESESENDDTEVSGGSTHIILSACLSIWEYVCVGGMAVITHINLSVCLSGNMCVGTME